MRTIDKFERLGQNNYNGQSVLKNIYLKSYPVHLTDDTSDYSVVSQYADRAEFVWIVDKNIEVLKTFPWHFKPKEKDCVHLFPYVHKRSKKPIDWTHVRLVPTVGSCEKFIQHRNICGEYDVYCGKQLFDLFFYGSKDTGTWSQIVAKYPNAQHVTSFNEAKEKTTTDMFWYVPDDVLIVDELFFAYEPDDWSLDYIHVFANGRIDQFDGIALFPKSAEPTEKELTYRYYANKKEVRKVITKPKSYNVYYIDSYEEYLHAVESSPYEMFWALSKNIQVDDDFDFSLYFSHHEAFDRSINHAFVHRVHSKNYYNGVFLFSKNSLVTKNEIEYRNPINRKEWNNVASTAIEYEKFYIDSYEDYLYALKNSKAEMFWALRHDIQIDPAFDFSFYFSHDSYDRKENHAFIHQVNDKQTYDGVFLFSKHKPVTQKEIEHHYLVERKEWDIIASGPVLYDQFIIDTYEEYLYALENSKTEMFWGTSRNIAIADDFKFDLFFDNRDDSFLYERRENHAFIHRVGEEDLYNGVFLFSKHNTVTQKEIENRFIVERKEWDIVASGPIEYDRFFIKTYEDYQHALANSKTEMFWGIDPRVAIEKNFKFDIYFTHDNTYDRNQNHVFLHKQGNKTFKDSVFLFSKHKPVTENEINHQFLVDKKEWPRVASVYKPYDQFYVDSWEEYLYALENTTTEMFWALSRNVKIDPNFKLDIYFEYRTDEFDYERKENHAFIHRVNDEDLYNGIFLMSIHKPVTQKEIENRYLINRKNWHMIASGPVQYDRFTVDTYDDYLYAVKNSKTEMFWAVSSNVNTSGFNFDVYFTHDNTYDRTTNHAFAHEVDGEKYYNGIFLLPKVDLPDEIDDLEDSL